MPAERKANEHTHHESRRQQHKPLKENKEAKQHSDRQRDVNKVKSNSKRVSGVEKKETHTNEKPNISSRPGTPFQEEPPENAIEYNNEEKGHANNPELESMEIRQNVEKMFPEPVNNQKVEEHSSNGSKGNIYQKNIQHKEPRSVSAGVRRGQTSDFDIKSFNSSISDYVELFSSTKYTTMHSDYPVDDLISVVSEISVAIEDYKMFTIESQRQLEELRTRMKTVKENIHMSVTRQALDLQNDDEIYTIEEKELYEKLTKLNAEVAVANADVAEAVRLSAETETTAVKAQISTERARMEAESIQEEIDFKAKVEREKKAEQERLAEEERLRREEQERKEEQARLAREAEWRRREANSLHKTPLCEKEDWPVHEITEPSEDDNEDTIICSLRGHPTKFGLDLVKCNILEQEDANITFNDHEELVSKVLEIKSVHNEDEFKDPIYVGIPHFQSRAAATSREVIVKTDIGGVWIDLPTKEVAFDNRKDVKFAQAEVKSPGILVVMSRFKQDYVTLTRKSSKLVSSFDQRISFSFPRDSVPDNQNLLVQVQYVDSASVHDYRSREPKAKAMLTSSHIVHMDWDSGEILKPVTITLPCPPNPAKAKKIAQLRKMKEDKMKQPRNAPKTIAELEKEEAMKAKKVAKKQKTEEEETEDDGETRIVRKTQNRWYMGEYASSDDDENDLLYFLAYTNGRWNIDPDVLIKSTKLDLVTFDLLKTFDRFMVIRTRTNVAEDTVPLLAQGLNQYLAKRFVQVILRQKNEDPFEATLTICPAIRLDKTLKKLSDEGYVESPCAPLQVCVAEGDFIEISFRGNVTNTEPDTHLTIPYNTHVHSQMYFSVSEVDKYLQKNFPMYRGLVQVFRKYKQKKTVIKTIGRKQDDTESKEPEIKTELLCELLLSIPKYHIEPSAVPIKAPIKIYNTNDTVNENTMRNLANGLGDEWKKVAHYLNVHKIRIQAILRNMNVGEKSSEEAKYEMLMTWLKRVPKAADKISILSSALARSGRHDLVESLRSGGKVYHHQEGKEQNSFE